MKTFILILLVFADNPQNPDHIEVLQSFDDMEACDYAAQRVNERPGHAVAACIEG